MTRINEQTAMDEAIVKCIQTISPTYAKIIVHSYLENPSYTNQSQFDKLSNTKFPIIKLTNEEKQSLDELVDGQIEFTELEKSNQELNQAEKSLVKLREKYSVEGYDLEEQISTNDAILETIFTGYNAFRNLQKEFHKLEEAIQNINTTKTYTTPLEFAKDFVEFTQASSALGKIGGASMHYGKQDTQTNLGQYMLTESNINFLEDYKAQLEQANSQLTNPHNEA